MEKTVAPVNVSPFIKGTRWTLLIAGIIYGTTRNNFLRSREQKRLAELEKTRPEREAKIAAEKERITKEQIEELSKHLGSKI